MLGAVFSAPQLRAAATGTGARRRFVHTGAFEAVAKAFAASPPRKGRKSGEKKIIKKEGEREIKRRRRYENQLFVLN